MASVTRTIETAFVVALFWLATACSSSAAATDTMPTNADNARQLAHTVASNGGCDGFEDYNFNRAMDMWVFTCQKQGTSFEIVAYGSQEARSAGIKSLSDRNTAYFSRNFYTVAVVASDRSGSWDSALEPFKK